MAAEIAVMPLVLGGIFLLYFGSYLNRDYSRISDPDSLYAFLPLYHGQAKAFSMGEYPYWDPSLLGGMAIYNSAQCCALYPFFFLRCGLYQTPLDGVHQLYYVVFLHVFILMVSMYVMLRAFRAGIIPSLMGACLMTFSREAFDYAGYIPYIIPYSWLPLAIAGVYLALENQHPKLGFVLGVSGATLLTLASPSQPLVHFVWLVIAMTAIYVLWRRKKRQPVWPSLKNVLLIGVVSGLASSPAWLPPALAIHDTIRWVGDGGAIVGTQHIPWVSFLIDQFTLRELANVAVAMDLHKCIGNPYLGAVPLGLAFFSLFIRRRRWLIFALWGIGLYGLASAAGTHLGMTYLNFHLPGINLIRQPGRHVFLFMMAFSALGAFGFQHVSEWIRMPFPTQRRRHLQIALAGLSIFGVCCIAAAGQPLLMSLTCSAIIVAVFFAALSAARFARNALPSPAVGCLLAAAAIAHLCFLRPEIPLLAQGIYFNDDYQNSLRLWEELSRCKDSELYRAAVPASSNPMYFLFNCSNATYSNMRAYTTYLSPLSHQQYTQMFFCQNNRQRAKLNGIKYYISVLGDPAVPPDYRKIKELCGQGIYETDGAMPRCFIQSKIADSYESPEDFYAKVEKNDAYRRAVFVRRQDFDRLSTWLRASEGISTRIKKLTGAYNTLELSVEATKPAILVFNEYYTKDWKVTLDAKRQKTVPVNLTQIGVPLSAGRHLVRFEYAPTAFIWLCRLHYVVVFGLIGWLLLEAFQFCRVRIAGYRAVARPAVAPSPRFLGKTVRRVDTFG